MKKLLITNELETIHISEITDNHFIIALWQGKIVANISKHSDGFNAFTKNRKYCENWVNFTDLINELELNDCELLVYEIRS